MNLQCVSVKIRSRRQSQRLTLKEFPLENIFKCLSVPDQICLALSCKSTYSQFLDFLDVQGIAYISQLLPPQRRPLMHRNIDDLQNRPRIQLLHRLEDRRWKYCSGCWNLHRRSAWRCPLELLLRLGWNLPSPRRPPCMPYAKKFHICPCLTMTFPDKLHLIETIKLAGVRDPSTRQSYYNGMLYHPIFRRVRKWVGHDCTFSGHPLAEVDITVRFCWDEYFHALEIICLYDIRKRKAFKTHGAESSSLHLPMGSPSMRLKTPAMCPHKHTKRWLKQFFHEAGTTPSWLPRRSSAYRIIPGLCMCYTAGNEFIPYNRIQINIRSHV